MNNLLSGTIGALIATLLAVWFQQSAEKAKSRKDVMLVLVKWLDDIYVRLQEMHVYKDRLYKKQEPGFTHEEYKAISKDVRVLLLSEMIIVQVAYVYGDGEMLQRVCNLREMLRKVAHIFWTSEQEKWSDSSKGITELFEKRIDPIRAEVIEDFLGSTKNSGSFLRRVIMDFKVKKFIAREGLILLGVVIVSFSLIKLGAFISQHVGGDIFDKVAVEWHFKKAAYLLYPLYLLIRFISWAVGILKQKQ